MKIFLDLTTTDLEIEFLEIKGLLRKDVLAIKGMMIEDVRDLKLVRTMKITKKQTKRIGVHSCINN